MLFVRIAAAADPEDTGGLFDFLFGFFYNYSATIKTFKKKKKKVPNCTGTAG